MPSHSSTRPRNFNLRGTGDIVPLYVPGGHDRQPNYTQGFPNRPANPYASQEPSYGALQQAAASGGILSPPPGQAPYPTGPGSVGGPEYEFFSGNPWARSVIVPDSMLPMALKRISPDRGPFYTPNKNDTQILGEAYTWKWVAEHGGLKTCCRIPELGAPIWEQPPWEVMPSQGIEIQSMFSQPIGLVSGGPPFDGTDTIIGSYQVPKGYDGAISRFVAQAPGVSGFEEFSGSIVWRLKIGTRYAKNLGNVQNTYGSFTNALLVPGISIRVISGQTIEVIASIPNLSPVNGGVIAGGIFGWIYPRR